MLLITFLIVNGIFRFFLMLYNLYIDFLMALLSFFLYYIKRKIIRKIDLWRLLSY